MRCASHSLTVSFDESARVLPPHPAGQRAEVLASLRHPRTPPRVAAGRGEDDLVTVAEAGLEEAGQGGPHHFLACGREAQVVDQQHVRAHGGGGSRVGGHRTHGSRGRGRRRGTQIDRLEARDRLRLPIFEQGEVGGGQAADRAALGILHHRVHGDDLDLGGEARNLAALLGQGQHSEQRRERRYHESHGTMVQAASPPPFSAPTSCSSTLFGLHPRTNPAADRLSVGGRCFTSCTV
jgi:hypothetical protein